ncbi:hypothetical protein [Nocardioides speluncae]|uniref:hypothetical protein n=1 Tax=Nocardioides speluncae TaxID=2670337 RepID=UPI000D685931|nr:hypothetical protein [Nocardioides speluncae]
MSTFQLSQKDMKQAENAATKAADIARGHGSSVPLGAVGAAIPGAKSVGFLSELGTSWDEEIKAWADSTEAFGNDIAATSADTQTTDGAAGGLFDDLFGLIGGN